MLSDPINPLANKKKNPALIQFDEWFPAANNIGTAAAAREKAIVVREVCHFLLCCKLSIIKESLRSWILLIISWTLSKISAASFFSIAPEVGFEPTTNRLTVDRSAAELLRNIYLRY